MARDALTKAKRELEAAERDPRARAFGLSERLHALRVAFDELEQGQAWLALALLQIDASIAKLGKEPPLTPQHYQRLREMSV